MIAQLFPEVNNTLALFCALLPFMVIAFIALAYMKRDIDEMNRRDK